MAEKELISQLWRIRRTCAQMLRDRNYLVSSDDLDMKIEEFSEKFADVGISGIRDRMSFTCGKKDDPTDMITVFYPEEAKVGVKVLKEYCLKMDSEKIRRGLVVAQQGLTPFAKQTLQELSDKYLLEQFQEEELLVNITEHVLVPKHIVLNSEEKTALLARYKLKDSQLPRIQITDPVARYYGMGKGQVCIFSHFSY